MSQKIKLYLVLSAIVATVLGLVSVQAQEGNRDGIPRTRLNTPSQPLGHGQATSTGLGTSTSSQGGGNVAPRQERRERPQENDAGGGNLNPQDVEPAQAPQAPVQQQAPVVDAPQNQEAQPQENFVDNGNCNYNTPQEFQKFLLKTKDSYSMNGETAAEVLNELKGCEGRIRSLNLQNCFQNLKSHAEVRQKVNSTGHSMKFEIPDVEYYEARKHLFVLPPELADGLPANWKEVAAEKGWNVLEYRSRTVNNPPNGSLRRALFFIRKEHYDQWIQFTLPDVTFSRPNNANNIERLIDMIVVEREEQKNGTWTKLINPRINFTQYWRDSQGRNPQISHKAGRGYDQCFACHPSGMRHLSPFPGSPSDIGLVKKYNDIMDSYGELDWGGAIHPPAWGPPKGKAAGCIECHNGFAGNYKFRRGAINGFTDDSHVRHKTNVELTMPPTARSLSLARPFNEAMDKANSLSPEQKLKLYDVNQSDTEGIIRVLYDFGTLNAQEHEAAMNSYKKIRGIVTKATTTPSDRNSTVAMNKEYRDLTQLWMMGGKNSCAANLNASLSIKSTRKPSGSGIASLDLKIPCERQVLEAIGTLAVPTKWNPPQKSSSGGATVLTAQTEDPGVTLELQVSMNQSVLIRKKAGAAVTVRYQSPQCYSSLLEDMAGKSRLKLPKKLFTDANLNQLLSGSRQNSRKGVIYMWSPRMPLSITGVNEMVTLSQSMGLDLTVIADSHPSTSEIEKIVKKQKWPASFGLQLGSAQLVDKNMNVHYPSMMVYRDGSFRGLYRPGYEEPVRLRKTLERSLETNK